MLSAKPWRPETVIWFCTTQLVSICVALILIGTLEKAGFAAFRPLIGPGAIVLDTFAFQGVTWVLIYFFLRMHDVDWQDAFGLHWKELHRAWLPAVPVVLAFLPVAWLLQNLALQVFARLGWSTESEAAVTALMNAKALWLRIYLAGFTLVIAPVAEEFIFRGMLYPFVKQFRWPTLTRRVRQLGWPGFAWFLRQRVWRILAWAGVSFLFALIHWDAAAFLPLFLLALILTWLYERTDSLLAPITAHALFNAVNFVLLCVFQGEIKSGPS